MQVAEILGAPAKRTTDAESSRSVTPRQMMIGKRVQVVLAGELVGV
jgi:hypothetical protein